MRCLTLFNTMYREAPTAGQGPHRHLKVTFQRPKGQPAPAAESGSLWVRDAVDWDGFEGGAVERGDVTCEWERRGESISGCEASYL